MGKDTVVQVILRLRDEMGAQAKKALDAVAQATGGVAKGVETAGRAASKLGAVRDATGRLQSAARDATSQLQAAGRAAGAIRGERINAAAQATARLGREARTSRRELDEAAKAGGRLAASLAKAGSAGKAAWGASRGVGQVASGTAAGAAVAGAALKKPIDFEKRMTLMANTAYADERDPAKRLAGRRKLVDSVNTAVRQGGGTRDEAAEALDKMLSSGALKEDTARNLLPTIQKFATASGAGSGDISEILIRGIQQKFFTEGQAGEALDKALAAGQAGGFELKDMAKWLPKMMAMGSGMKGMGGYEQILAYAQAAATTAGSKDEAGNNLVNLLQKINSSDTQKDFARLGINLTGTLVKAREKGILPLEAFARLIEKHVAGKDPRYKQLQKRLGAAQGDEKKQILGDMADLANASAVGQVVQDRQALLALIAAINQKEYVKEVLGRMKESKGEGDRSFATYQGSTAYSTERFANEAEIARSNMLGDVSGPLKGVADTAADLAQRFPTLATMAMEATTAIGAMTAAAAAFGAMRLFTGGGAGATAAGGLGFLKGTGGLLKGAGVLGAAGLAAWGIYSTEKNDTLTRAQKNIANSGTYGATGGALAGAAMGAAAGSVVPVIGTTIGGLLGGAFGWWAGGKAGREVGNRAFGGPSGETVQGAQQLIQPREENIKFESVLHLDGREVARVVNDYNKIDSLRD
jgi:hypothetical protein